MDQYHIIFTYEFMIKKKKEQNNPLSWKKFVLSGTYHKRQRNKPNQGSIMYLSSRQNNKNNELSFGTTSNK